LTINGQPDGAGKLQEDPAQRPITYKGQNIVNLGMLAIAIASPSIWCSIRSHAPVSHHVASRLVFAVM